MNRDNPQTPPHAALRDPRTLSDARPGIDSAEPRGGPPIGRLAWAAYILAAVVIVFDQLSKWWVVQVVHLPAREQIAVLPFFRLSMVWNPGVSYGLLRRWRSGRDG